jgi:hypothetical protein
MKREIICFILANLPAQRQHIAQHAAYHTHIGYRIGNRSGFCRTMPKGSPTGHSV